MREGSGSLCQYSVVPKPSHRRREVAVAGESQGDGRSQIPRRALGERKIKHRKDETKQSTAKRGNARRRKAKQDEARRSKAKQRDTKQSKAKHGKATQRDEY